MTRFIHLAFQQTKAVSKHGFCFNEIVLVLLNKQIFDIGQIALALGNFIRR